MHTTGPTRCELRLAAGLIAFLILILAVGSPLAAQESASAPLTVGEQGSFFVGGTVKTVSPGNDVTIHQMYVSYQVPVGKRRTPVVFTHGCCLSSKTWETTPDGRMGWSEYFLRAGHAVYLTDQVGRARSGFDATPFNQVREGTLAPSQQPGINHASHQFAWRVFRFGEYPVPFPGVRFPMDAVDELYKQMIPDLNSGLPVPTPTWQALADLAAQIHGAVLVGHSQSGTFPFEAALINPAGVRGLVSIEPGACDRSGYSAEQIAALARHPILVVFGDFLAELGGFWQRAYDNCIGFIEQVNAAGGNATMLYPPDLGIHGNTHMLMQDDNSLELADMVLAWIAEQVEP